MGNKEIRILHIDTELKWGGGQQQSVYLFEGLLKKNYYSTFVCKPNSELKKYFVKNKLPFFEQQMSSEIDLLSSYKIASFCKKNNITLIYLHSAGAHAIGLFVKVFYPKLKIIVIRRVNFEIRKNYLSQLKYKSSLVNLFVTISRDIKKTLLNAGISEKKTKVIYDGIDLNRFVNTKSDLRNELKISPNAIIVGTIAALEGTKDYPNLLKSAKIVTDKISNIIFIAVGNGRDKDKIEKIHNELNLGEKFIFTGFRNDVGSFLSLFDVFILPSKNEGLGTSILDAQSFGLPVIATKVGGIPEIVNDRINGILVSPQNSNELASAIIELVTNKLKREKFGRNGEKSVKDFDIELNIKRHINLIEKLFA